MKKISKKNQDILTYIGIIAVINLLILVVMYVYLNANKEPIVSFNTGIGIVAGGAIAIIIACVSTRQIRANKEFLKEIKWMVTKQQNKELEKEIQENLKKNQAKLTVIEQIFGINLTFLGINENDDIESSYHELPDYFQNNFKRIIQEFEPFLYSFYIANHQWFPQYFDHDVKNMHGFLARIDDDIKNNKTTITMAHVWGHFLVMYERILSDIDLKDHPDIKKYREQYNKSWKIYTQKMRNITD